MRAELRALLGRQGALQQGAEDGRLHVAPIAPRRNNQFAKHAFINGQGSGVPEQAAVEVAHIVF